jgi:hypothetical protein
MKDRGGRRTRKSGVMCRRYRMWKWGLGVRGRWRVLVSVGMRMRMWDRLRGARKIHGGRRVYTTRW